jgi:hypothetical protein
MIIILRIILFRWVLRKFSMARFNPSLKSDFKFNNNKKLKKSPFREDTIAEKIPIKSTLEIDDKRYHRFVIYESIKCKNMKEMMDYFSFVLNHRKVLSSFYCPPPENNYNNMNNITNPNHPNTDSSPNHSPPSRTKSGNKPNSNLLHKYTNSI